MAAKLFSFFSGAGFLDLGFEAEDFNVVFVNEYCPPFLSAYKHSRKSMKSPYQDMDTTLGLSRISRVVACSTAA